MYYHIGRMLIDENFNDKTDCPVCAIRKTVDRRLTEQYLGEGVMEDDTRKEVNELGFCREHFDSLFSMRSKLGLALQASTRLKALDRLIVEPKNPSAAKKTSERIREKTSRCVVCKYLDEHMIRYYKTIAEVYSGDPAFKDRIESGNGFCIPHYSDLIAYSSYAGAKSKEYLSSLFRAEKRRIGKADKLLDGFCNRHDYRNAAAPLGEEKNALPNARRTFYGDY